MQVAVALHRLSKCPVVFAGAVPAGAIDTLCTGGMFDRARLLAGINPQLLQHIEQQHTQHLVENNDAEQLAARGNAAAAVDMYAAQGNWKRAHELVRRACSTACRT